MDRICRRPRLGPARRGERLVLSAHRRWARPLDHLRTEDACAQGPCSARSGLSRVGRRYLFRLSEQVNAGSGQDDVRIGATVVAAIIAILGLVLSSAGSLWVLFRSDDTNKKNRSLSGTGSRLSAC